MRNVNVVTATLTLWRSEILPEPECEDIFKLTGVTRSSRTTEDILLVFKLSFFLRVEGSESLEACN